MSLYIFSMYKSLYTTSVFLIYFLHIKLSQHFPTACPVSIEHSGKLEGLRCSLPEWLERNKDQSNVVIFNWLTVDITIVDKNGHYSLKYTLLHLTHLWDFFSYCFHTDISRQLSFPSRSIDGALQTRENIELEYVCKILR